MAERAAPALFTVPAHRPFADALAAGLIARTGGDRLALARGLVLVPNNRAARAISDAFVRRAEHGLLLPRLVPIGDLDLGDGPGSALDPADGAPVPPAVDPMVRRMVLARLVSEERRRIGEPVDAAEAVRLAQALGRTLDQMMVEEVPIRALADLDVEADLSEHWQRALGVLAAVLARWPGELAAMGRIDQADRRNRLLDRAAAAWGEQTPQGFVVAAGITDTAPAVARLLRAIARLPEGIVLLPGLDLSMPEAEWDALGPREDGRAIETHPQFHLKRLLDRMGMARSEAERWAWGGGAEAPASSAARGRAIANAMAPAAFTGKWQDLPPAERRIGGVRALECATPAEEAQAIAIALRQAIETPGRTAALVTPDRVLARRVSAHLARWGIRADDSAGRPLSALPPGTLLTAIAEAAASGFAPVELLTLLKHPLVRGEGERLDWLTAVRGLDLALRGPRPAPGLAGVGALVRDPRHKLDSSWWRGVLGILEPLEAAFAGRVALPVVLAAIRDAASALTEDEAWAGPAGRAAAELFEALEASAPLGPSELAPAAVAPMLARLMDEVAVRPPQGGHPRVSIWGLIEQRLQHADFEVAAGLNEGVWPALPSPDPWLSPRVRRALGLPGLEWRIGIAAHDFASVLGSPGVLVTRTRRDARAPAVASRFWLRLEAMTGGIARAPHLRRWTAAIDRPDAFAPADRPRPAPPAEERPRKLAVTRLDRLKADPYAFYAQEMLKLVSLDPVDAEPSPAWRGSAVHEVLEAWAKEDACDPSKLAARAEAMLDGITAHPVLRALWAPRLRESIAWIADEMLGLLVAGRKPIVAEVFGEREVDGIRLYGKVDRIDRLPDGSLAIVDYKTGQPPGPKQVAAGYAMQLGLLGLIAEQGGFKEVAGKAGAFEYWSLAQKDGQLGYVAPATGKRSGLDPAEFTALAYRNFAEAAAKWLTGEEPFVAKLHPELAPYADYDQLMRLDEWYGRQGDGA
ncbi:MAG TPA: double-strand break repair protein AddB [Sphingomonas sp.]|nr:double-strand break repair protein AddB [Sphingomonas sp.]